MYELPSPMRVLCTSGKNCEDWSPTLRKRLGLGLGLGLGVRGSNPDPDPDPDPDPNLTLTPTLRKSRFEPPPSERG